MNVQQQHNIMNICNTFLTRTQVMKSVICKFR